MEVDSIVEGLQSFLQKDRKNSRAPDNFDETLVATCVCGDNKSRSLLKISFRAWFVVLFAPNCRDIIAKLDHSNVDLLAQRLETETAHETLNQLLKKVLAGDGPAAKIRRALVVTGGSGTSVPKDWIESAEIHRIKKRKWFTGNSPDNDEVQDGQHVEETPREQQRHDDASSPSLASRLSHDARMYTTAEQHAQGLLQRSQPLAQRLPRVFPQRMYDAIVKTDIYSAVLVLTHWSPSFVTLDIDVHKTAVPELVSELFGETIRYTDEKENPGWKLILKGGSEVVLSAEFKFDRARDQGIKTVLGDQVHEAISKDPVRYLEVQMGEGLTRRVSMTICPGPSSRLHIALDASVMMALESALWFSIV
ncbi:hypothetical protein MAJ_09175, partial [Metarhizium majus ARSEF 297]